MTDCHGNGGRSLRFSSFRLRLEPEMSLITEWDSTTLVQNNPLFCKSWLEWKRWADWTNNWLKNAQERYTNETDKLMWTWCLQGKNLLIVCDYKQSEGVTVCSGHIRTGSVVCVSVCTLHCNYDWSKESIIVFVWRDARVENLTAGTGLHENMLQFWVSL